MKGFFRRVFRCVNDPECRCILLPPDLWAQSPKKLPWPEALGNIMFIFGCLFTLFTASLLAAPAPRVQIALVFLAGALDVTMMVWQLLTWGVRWAVRLGWLRE
jgi:hypothetical protein